ncbi:MAG: hypothetical protein ABFD07_05000 [Methanobacterium sp.]
MRYCMDNRVEDHDTAILLLDKIKHLRNDIEFLNWQAMLEFECKRYKRAFQTSEKILDELKNAATYFNAGRAAYKANELEKSELYLRKSIELNPHDTSLLLDYSITICSMGEFDKALEIIEGINVNTLDYKHKKIVDFNKGWHYIRKNDFKKGMELINVGREIGIWGSGHNYNKPKWDGSIQPGKTILIAGEAGIGDEIINSRFSENIKNLGMNCIMSTVHNNISMLSSVKTLDKVIDYTEINNTEYDYYVPCMDIPYVMKLDIDDIPSKKYLYSKQEYVDKYKDIIKTDKKLKVGIRYMGNPRFELELGRTIPVELFESLNELDVQLYSLQKNDGIENMKLPKDVIDLEEHLNSWDDTLGIIENLDLVITSCTSVAHASAALGKKTFVVVPLLPYYTWSNMEKNSYWYDSVTVYRQQKYNSYVEPFIEIKNDLASLLSKI